MVDVLSTRLQEVYAKWESRTDVTREPDSSTTRFSLDGLRQAGQQIQRKRAHSREQARKARELSLFKIKESEPAVPHFDRSSSSTTLLQYCCKSCTPSSRDSLVNTVSKEHQPYGVNILLINPKPTIFSKLFKHVAEVYSYKKYVHPRVTHTVLNDERLKDAVKLAAWETAKTEGISEKNAIAKVESRAKTILSQMESKLSDTLLRIIAYLILKVMPSFVKAAIVQPSQIEVLKKANDVGLPLIFVPLHRSHLDYILTSLILFSNGIRNPLIAAGDNLKIPFFDWLLRGLGAFFIKRRIDPVAGRKDVLYRSILHTYIVETLRAGHNMQFFVEGGRTRTGKPCMPKAGILSMIVDAYMDGTVEDALLVPMTINYERLVDGNFVREQLGQPKKLETFGGTIRAIWGTLMGNYGIIKVDISQPFSLREMLKSFQAQQTKLSIPGGAEKTLKVTVSSSSLYGTDVVVEEHRQLIDSIARHVVYDAAKNTPIMSTNVTAFLLLYKFRDGCTLDKLVEAFDAMREQLKYRNKDVAFCGETVDIVNHALDILGPGLVKQQRQEITEAVEGQAIRSDLVTAIRPVSILPNVIEIAYYANTMVLHYALESAIVTGLYAEVQSKMQDPKVTVEDDVIVYHDALLARALEVCDILKYEFIFAKPCEELESVVADEIRNLTFSGIISTVEETYLEDELWSRRYASTLDDSSDEEYALKNPARKLRYKLHLEPEPSRHMEFLHTVLRPLIDTYTFSAFTLRKLVGRSLSERDLVQEVLSEIKTNLDRGIVSYGESLCVDPVKNALKLFEKWNVLECHPQENVKIYYLKDEYDEDAAASQIYETIAAYKWTRKVD